MDGRDGKKESKTFLKALLVVLTAAALLYALSCVVRTFTDDPKGDVALQEVDVFVLPAAENGHGSAFGL